MATAATDPSMCERAALRYGHVLSTVDGWLLMDGDELVADFKVRGVQTLAMLIELSKGRRGAAISLPTVSVRWSDVAERVDDLLRLALGEEYHWEVLT